MTLAGEVLTELQRRGVTVAVEGDSLWLKPRRALDYELLERVREAKPAILETLRTDRPRVQHRATRLIRVAGFTIPGMAVPRSSRKQADRSTKSR
jgi:hypothetical protein